ncbi:MAG: type II secretion system protein [Sulfuricellaceae bacterium]
MKTQSGFTLIEMVAVIIILAIMAATAMPRFVNMSGDARLSSLQGMAAAATSAKTLVKSRWIMGQSANLNNVDMGGGYMVSTISYTTGPSSLDLYGIPSAMTSGIWAALDNPTGFASALVTDVATAPGGLPGVAIWPTGVGVSQDCFMYYDTSGLVTVSNLHATTPTATGCL